MRNVYVFMCLMLFPLLGFSQDWMNSGGGIGNDAALDVVVDQNGNVFTTGYLEGSVVFGGGQASVVSNGFSDIYLSKSDASGNFLWVKSFGGLSADRGQDMAIDNLGNIYLTGYFIGSANFDGTIINSVGGSQDIFVAKFDNSGSLIWVIGEGGTQGETGYGIDVDSQGNVVLTGQFQGTSDIGGMNFTSVTDPNTGLPSFDLFIAKYDNNGNPLWAKQGEAEFDDRGLSVSIDGNDNIYVGGQFSDVLTIDGVVHNNTALNAGFLMKLDASGSEDWFRTLAASQTLVRDIEVNSNNDVYITGDFQGQMLVLGGSAPYNLTGNYTYHYFVLLLENNGDVVWDAVSSSESELSSKAICVDANDDIYITGTFKCVLDDYADQMGEGFFNSVGYYDIFMTKYDLNGNRVYSYQYGGQYDDFCSAIDIDQVDDPILSGSFNKVFTFNVGANFQNSIGTSVNHVTQLGCMPSGNNCQLGYTNYRLLLSNGVQDIFVGKITDPTIVTYYYYMNSLCGETSGFCLSDCASLTLCPDTIIECGSSVHVSALTFTEGFGANPSPTSGIYTIGPYYNFTFGGSAGTLAQNHSNIIVNSDGYLNVHGTTIDGCSNYYDTVYVDVGATVYVDTLIQDTIVPVLGLVDIVDYNDSITVCEGEDVDFVIMDSLSNPSLNFNIPYCGQVNSQVWFGANSGSGCLKKSKSFTNTGWYVVDVDFILEETGPNCLIDTMHYNVVDSFYVEVIPVGVYDIAINTISGDSLFCPGDTIAIWVDSALAGFNWFGVLSENAAGDTAWVNSSGFYMYYGGTVTDPTTGCPLNISGGSIILDAKVSGSIWSNVPDNLICPGDSLMLSTGAYQSYQWVGPQGFVVGVGQSVWVDVPGFYYCLQTDSSGCTLSSNTIELLEYSTPFLLAGPSTNLCDTNVIEVSVLHSGSPSFSWYGPIVSTSDTILITQPGTYYVEATQCGFTVTDSVIITPSTAIAEIVSISDTLVCQGDTVVLEANPGMVSYNWQPSNTGPQISVVNSGFYTVTTISGDGCTATSDPVYFGYKPGPLVPDVVVPDGGCEGETIQMVDNNYSILYDVSWSFMQQVISDSNIVEIENFNPSNQGMYTITHQYLGCEIDTTIYLDYFLNPILTYFSIGSPGCIGDDLHLIAASDSGVVFEWSGPNYFHIGESDVLSDIQYSNQGTYYLSYTSLQGCTSIDSMELTVNEYPVLDLGVDSVICEGKEILLDAGDDYDSYLWSNGSNNYFILSSEEGWYWLEVANGNCKTRDSLYVGLKNCNVQPANVFSPNNDGINDDWRIPGEELTKPDVIIYNRWGRIVGKVNEDNETWNGRHYLSDKALSEGVYYFVGSVTDGFNNRTEVNGFIHLIRK